MPEKDKRTTAGVSGGKFRTAGRIVARYKDIKGHNFDAICMGQGVIGGAPAGLTPSTATSGGTLAASTYFYRVTAIVNFTETAAAAEQSQVTTGSTSTVTLNWTAVSGATAYKVYGRATGAELFMATVLTNSFVDTGAITPAGALVAGTLGLKLRIGRNGMVIDNVHQATSMHDVDAYYSPGVTTT